MIKKEKQQIEKDFISLLLQNKALVDTWANDGPQLEFFCEEYRPILTAIRIAYNQNSLLTRRHFLTVLRNGPLRKMDIIAQEAVFNRINANIASVNSDDFAHLKQLIVESYIKQNVVFYIDRYKENLKAKGGMFSVQKLTSQLNDLVDLNSAEKQPIYEDAYVYAPEYIKMLEDKAARGDEDIITCGIKEIDYSMVVGFSPGSLTLFCGDVGSFKCQCGSTVVNDINRGRISLKTVDELLSNNQDVYIQQLNLKNMKLNYKKVIKSINSGKKDCYKIKTTLGNEIISTSGHRHMTFDGFVETKYLNENNYLAAIRKSDFGGVGVSIYESLWLGAMLSEGGTSSPGYTFSNNDSRIVSVMKKASEKLGGSLRKNSKKRRGSYRVRSLREYGKKYELDGVKAIDKHIHSCVFLWDKKSISNMLRMMYSGDGSFSVNYSNKKRKNPVYAIIYSTSSKQLAKDVRDLLLKFNIVAKIKEYDSYYKKDGIKINKGKTWRVYISDVQQMLVFIKEIGFIGKKQDLVEKHLEILQSIKPNPNSDIVPSKIWNLLNRKFKEYGKSRTGCRRHYKRNIHANWKNDMGHCGNIKKTITRGCLRKIAKYLDDDPELLALADSDIYWDKIISIEHIDKRQTYDLVMPDCHNFVANNIVTHNSSMMANVGINIWKDKKKNVLVVPLEMPRDKWFQRLVSRETAISFDRLEHSSMLTDNEWVKVRSVHKDWDEWKHRLYIMEAPERVSVSYIRREIERHVEVFKPDVVVIDYIANLVPNKGSKRDRNDLEIGYMLKDLRQMGRPGGMGICPEGFAVISGAQIGREALKRVRKLGTAKTGFYSEDLRNSQEYAADADNIYAQIPDPDNKERLYFYCVKTRYGKCLFPNGSTRATLEVDGNIGMIKSESADWIDNTKKDEILKKASEHIDKIDEPDENDMPWAKKDTVDIGL